MKQFSITLEARQAWIRPLLVATLACTGVPGCGPSLDADRIMTPDERLDEQERLAYESEQENKKKGGGPQVELTEEDDTKAFDKKQATLELRRASLSAVTCLDVIEDKKKPKGEGDLNITFVHDGGVKEVTIGAPFAGSVLEECVLNAYRGVIVPPFKEAEFSMPWRVDLTGKKRDLMKEDKKEVLLPEAKTEEKPEDKDDAKSKKKKAAKKK
jgi:hypothetical protein